MAIVLVVLPTFVLAVDTPIAITDMPDELVPCGDPGQETCQTCHFYQLTRNVSQWLFGLTTFIVILLIIYGGLRLAASTGNQVAMRDARKLIGSAVVGFALVLSSWILVDLMIGVLSGSPTDGIWDSFQCVKQPEPGTRVEVCTTVEIILATQTPDPGCTCTGIQATNNFDRQRCECRVTRTLGPGESPANGCTVETSSP